MEFETLRSTAEFLAIEKGLYSLHKYCRHKNDNKNNESIKNISYTFTQYLNRYILWNIFFRGLTTDSIVPVRYSDRKPHKKSIFKAYVKFWKRNVSHCDGLSSIVKAIYIILNTWKVHRQQFRGVPRSSFF